MVAGRSPASALSWRCHMNDVFHRNRALVREFMRKGVRITKLPDNQVLSPAMVDQLLFKYLGTEHEENVFDWIAEALEVDSIVFEHEGTKMTIHLTTESALRAMQADMPPENMV